MNKFQKQFILVEGIVVSLLLWRYYNNQLTFNNILLYTFIYVACMFGWFYFKDQ